MSSVNELMKIATFNTNSVRARLPIIKQWLSETKPDVLAIQEIKAQERDFPIQDFEELGYHTTILGQKSYNGVAILSKEAPGAIRKGLYGDTNEEARFLSVSVSGITIINIYVPQGVAPGADKFVYKLKWLNDLFTFIDTHHSPSDPLIILGDFNVAMAPMDVYDPDGLKGSVGFHPDEQAMLARLFDWGFVDLFRKHHPEPGQFTFWDYRIPNGVKRNLGWRIDYIIATEPIARKSVSAHIDIKPRLFERPSDHTFLVAEFDLSI
jgi:exodeoxyribonuclease III